MLSDQEARDLSVQLEAMTCSNPKVADGLFSFVLLGEKRDHESRYMSHIIECSYCRTARELYRYKRDIVKGIGKI